MRTIKSGSNIKLLLLILCFFGILPLKAQKAYQVNITYLQGIHYNSTWSFFKGGSELSARMLFHKESIGFGAGLNLRTVQWGSQVSGTLLVSKAFSESIVGVFEIQNGAALFRDKALYNYTLSLKSNYLIFKKPRLQVGATTGLRFTSCPGYADYSEIYSVLEMPFGMFIRF